MNNNGTHNDDTITCPRSTDWCTEHDGDSDQCVGAPINIAPGCSVWLQQELPGIEPIIVVDTKPSGVDLPMDQAGDLADAIRELRGHALAGARS